VEVDVVVRLASGGTMTGSVKWNRRPLCVDVFRAHLEALTRTADAAMRWAHEGRDGPLLFLAAGGFDARFLAAVEAHPTPVYAWTLEDVCAEV
jgi:hypothetical protein